MLRRPAFLEGAVAVAVLIALLAVTGLGAQLSADALSERTAVGTRSDAESTAEAINTHLSVYTEALYGNRALFLDGGDVSRAVYSQHVRSSGVIDRRPGVLGIAFAQHVTGDRVAAFVAAANRDIASSGQPYPPLEIDPPGQRGEYVVISHIEPPEKNQAAIGFDFLSEPIRRSAVETARDTGAPTASAPIDLIQDETSQSGFLLMVPQYRAGVVTDTVEQRRAAFEGVHYAAIRMPDLVDSITGQQAASAAVRVADVGSTRPIAFSSGVVVTYENANARANGDQYESVEVPLTVGDRRWVITYADTMAAVGSLERMLPAIIGLAGVVVSIITALLLATALRSRRTAMANSLRATRLQQVTARLSAALSVDQVADTAVAEVSAILGADRGAVSVLDLETARLDLVGSDRRRWRGDESFYQSLNEDLPMALAARSRGFIEIEDIQATHADNKDLMAMAAAEGAKAIVAAPLVVGEQLVGAWRMTWPHRRRLQREERELLFTLSTQCAQALERALVFQRQRNTSIALQRRLLPPSLPETDDAEIAVRYVPAAGDVEVGGDWYDVFFTPDRRIAFAMGDVAGHGLQAAAAMGEIRNTLRAYALEGHSPNIVVERMNALLTGAQSDLSTCTYGELDQFTGRVTLVRCGHVPAFVRCAEGGARLIEDEPNLPLGVDPRAAFDESSFFLSPGDTILLFTDGLVETADSDLGDRLEELRSVLAAVEGDDVETLVGEVLHAMVPGDEGRDDIAVLALRYAPVRLPGVGDERRVTRTFSSEPVSARAARNFVSDVLEEWGASTVIDDAVLLSSELVTNALIHSADDFDIVLEYRSHAVRVEVHDRSDRLPVVVDTTDASTSGRGMGIVSMVATRWGAESKKTGKSVWFELEFSPVS